MEYAIVAAGSLLGVDLLGYIEKILCLNHQGLTFYLNYYNFRREIYNKWVKKCEEYD